MKKYHYSDGVNSYGPVSLEELKSKNITANTLIWSEDLVIWTKAGDVAELKGLFDWTTETTPPVNAPAANTFGNFNPETARPPKTYLIEAILTTIFCCWPLGIPAIVYASRVEKKFYAGDIEGAEEASANAKRWLVINLVICAMLWVGYLSIFGWKLLSAL